MTNRSDQNNPTNPTNHNDNKLGRHRLWALAGLAFALITIVVTGWLMHSLSGSSPTSAVMVNIPPAAMSPSANAPPPAPSSENQASLAQVPAVQAPSSGAGASSAAPTAAAPPSTPSQTAVLPPPAFEPSLPRSD